MKVLGLSITVFASMLSLSTMAKELPGDKVVMTLGSEETLGLAKVDECADLVVRAEALAAVDPEGWIKIQTSSGCEAVAEVTVSVPYSAPSFAPLRILIGEADPKTGHIVSEVLLVLEVRAELVIKFYGEKGDTLWDTPEAIYLQPHATPVKVRFVNTKNESETGTTHRIHAEGAIPHSGGKDILTKIGDSYEYKVADTKPVEARYRDHITYRSNGTRKILFNVAPADIPPTAALFPLVFSAIK